MNPYLQVLELAAQAHSSHFERAAVQTRAHFAKHPECTHKILAMDADANVKRGVSLIDVESRCRPGWFTRAMWTQEIDSGRPIEALRGESSGYWYRIDDLTAEGAEAMPAGTYEAANLWKEALLTDQVARQIDAVRKAEVARRKSEAQMRRLARTQRPKQMALFPVSATAGSGQTAYGVFAQGI